MVGASVLDGTRSVEISVWSHMVIAMLHAQTLGNLVTSRRKY